MKCIIIAIPKFNSFFRALLNVMEKHSHLMEVDPLLVRSCLCLMPFDGLTECLTSINIELLDILQVFLNKAPQEISASVVTVSGNPS